MKKRKINKKRKRRYHRGNYLSLKSGEEYFYRSGWEQKYMIYLDESQDIISWTYEKLIIEYISNKKTMKIRKYYPDFQIEDKNGNKFIVEIKPLYKLKQAIIIKKIKAAKEWCLINNMTYKILTEIELKILGII